MQIAYSLLYATGLFLSLPYFLWKGRATGKYLRTFRERMGRLPDSPPRSGRPSIWIHAVSVGEALLARTLIAPLRARFPRHALFLSTTTVTGNELARRFPGLDGVFFVPFDLAGPLRRALARLDPALLLILETELWPNLIHEARRHGARVAIVNGRISPRSFPRYRRFRRLLGGTLREVDLFLMQGDEHARRIREMGAPPERVRVPGNLKYDAVPGAAPAESLLAAMAGHGARPLLVAGSTVEGEEPLLLAAFRGLRARVPGLALLLAPRHPERFAAVAALVEAGGFRCARRSGLGPHGWDGDVLLLDTLGELAQVYALATVVFVGGSLVARGGHNVLEAAAAGKPIVVGPHMENFQEIADEFLAAGALVQLPGPDGLAEALLALLEDAARRRELGARALAILERNRGACARAVLELAGLVA